MMLSSPRKALGNIMNTTPLSNGCTSAKLGETPTKKPSSLAKTTPASKGLRFAIRSSLRSPSTPAIAAVPKELEEAEVQTEAFGMTGVLQLSRGAAPPAVEAFDEKGILEMYRGQTPEAHRHEGRMAQAQVEAFIASHSDAYLIGDRVLCVPTGHEMPLDLATLTAHWSGTKYAKAVGAKRVRPLLSPTARASPAAKASVKAVGRSGGKVLKKSKSLDESEVPLSDTWSMNDVLQAEPTTPHLTLSTTLNNHQVNQPYHHPQTQTSTPPSPPVSLSTPTLPQIISPPRKLVLTSAVCRSG